MESFKQRSIRKHAGEEMSSRQMAPKVGPNSVTVLMKDSVSGTSRQMGKASTPAKVLKMTLFASIIG